MDIKKIKKDFPILTRQTNGHPLVYLDNAATSQKPKQVLEAIDEYYKKHNANVHRGIHTLSVEATEMYEAARSRIAKFVGIKDPAEVIFVRNATEAVNLVAYAWGRMNIGKGDEIVMTIMEHHSNFVPWQQLVAENGAVLKVVPVLGNGELDEEAFRKAITSKTKLVTFTHVSNVLGTINDVHRLSLIVHRESHKAKILVDGAQAVPHMKVDVDSLGVDFYVFTGHKMLAPMGIGVLWGKKEILESMPPFLFGGEMISKVTLSKTTWNELPWKFEAGTPNVGGAVGLAAACDYLDGIGMENVRKHEVELTKYAIEKLSKIPGVVTFGPKDASKRGGVVAFNVGLPLRSAEQSYVGQAVHAHDVASILDSEGIAIRSGHHCAEPLMDFLGVSSVARASFYIYNDRIDIDKLVEGVLRVKKTFKI
jgi:cysteine desulfurase/selenocysteine lyase